MAEKWEKKKRRGKFKDSGGQYAFDEEMLNRAAKAENLPEKRIPREEWVMKSLLLHSGCGKAWMSVDTRLPVRTMKSLYTLKVLGFARSQVLLPYNYRLHRRRQACLCGGMRIPMRTLDINSEWMESTPKKPGQMNLLFIIR